MFHHMCLFCFVTLASGLTDRNELFEKYGEIFPSNNRNAASHRWATYILERSVDMTDKTLRDLFAGFCPISGSPLGYDRPVSRWNMTLPTVSGGTSNGMLYYCCWPCVCDTMDFITIDTKTVKTSDGEQQYHFAVIGDPCKRSDAIPPQAPDVNCESNQLTKATFSDNGYVIIGMFFEPGVPDHSDSSVKSTQQDTLSETCQARAASGHQSGMGMIFREVASISPIIQRIPGAAVSASTVGATTIGAATTVVATATTSTTVSSSEGVDIGMGDVGAATTVAAIATTSTIGSSSEGVDIGMRDVGAATTVAAIAITSTTVSSSEGSSLPDTLSAAYSLRLIKGLLAGVFPVLLVGAF